MAFMQWENILFEWINCLNLTGPINTFQELRDGAFFETLLKLLLPEKSSNCILKVLTDFLTKHYAYIIFQYENDYKNLQNIAEDELLIILSLLLHFCCIYDRRDILTTPLCDKLSTKSQTCIKVFLECTTKTTTKEELFEIIIKCTTKSIKPKSLCIHTLPSTSSVDNTSLENLLQISQTRLQKRKEIKKLQSTIEMERLEKSDLQDELREQQEKNKNLNKQINDNTKEILKLRNKILDLENNISPQNEQRPTQPIDRNLQSVMNELESHVLQLQNEQDLLSNERNILQDTLKKTEEKLIIWETKAISNEKEFDDILEKNKQQELYIKSLQLQCFELKAFLEEVHPHQLANESSLEVDVSLSESMQGATCTGELACTVIEVQLKDAEKANKELKSFLKESQSAAKILKENLNTLQIRYNDLDSDYKTLKLNNDELFQKITNLTETLSTLSDVKLQLEQTLQQNSILDCNNSKIQKELLESKAVTEILNEKLKIVQAENETLQLSLNKKINQCNITEEYNIKIQTKYDELLNEYNQTNFNYQSSTKILNEFQLNIEEKLQILENFVFGNNSLNLQDPANAFDEIFLCMKQNQTDDVKEKNMLLSDIHNFEELSIKLRSDIDALNERETISLKERQTLSWNLNNAKEQILTLENSVSNYLEKINTLNNIVSEKCMALTEMELLRNKVIDLESNNKLLENKLKALVDKLEQNNLNQKHLKESLEHLKGIKSEFETKIIDSEKKLINTKKNEENLTRAVAELQALTGVFEEQIFTKHEELIKSKKNEENLQHTIENLKHQLFEENNKVSRHKSKEILLEKEKFEQEKQFQENIKMLNRQIEDYQIKINNLEMDLQNSKLSCISAQKDTKIIAGAKEKLCNEIESCREDFDKRIFVLDITIKNLQQDIQITTEEKNQIQEEFVKKCDQYDKLILKQNENILQYDVIKAQLIETIQKLNETEKECVLKDGVISQNNLDLLDLKEDIQQKAKQLDNLQLDVQQYNLQIHSFRNQISLLENQNTESRQELTELQEEYVVLENLRTSLQTKCDELETTAWKIVSDLSIKNKELSDIVAKYHQYQENTEYKITNLKDGLAESNSEFDHLTDTKGNLALESKVQIDDLEDKISQFAEVIHSFNNREKQYIEEIHITKDELNNSILKYTEALQIHQENNDRNEAQINTLTENLYDLIKKYNNLDKTHDETISKLKNAQDKLSNFEKEKIQIEAKLIEQKSAHEAKYNKSVADLNVQITDLVEKESQVKVQLIEINEKLKDSSENNATLQDNFKKMCILCAQLRKDKALLSKKLKTLQEKSEELKNVFNSLKLTHIQLGKENYQNLCQLQHDIRSHIGMLISENITLKNSVIELKEDLQIIHAEREILQDTHLHELNMINAEKKLFQDELTVFKQELNSLFNEKTLLEEQILVERKQFDEHKVNCEQKIASLQINVEEYEEHLIKLKCTISILEAGKEIVENDMGVVQVKFKELEEVKHSQEENFAEDIKGKDEKISSLNEKIKLLEDQVSLNSTKSQALILELCTVNESLDSVTKQQCQLQQMLDEQKDDFNKKAEQLEKHRKESIIEDLKTENQILLQDIVAVKKEIENLKEEIKSGLTQRQVLNVQIKITNEKLNEYEMIIQKKESVITEINNKLIEMLNEVLELNKAKSSLEENLKYLTVELTIEKKNRNELMDSQAKIMQETENNIIRAHESAIEVKNDLTKRIELMEKEKHNEKQLRNELQQLLESEKEAKDNLECRILELTNEKCKMAQLLLWLKQSIHCLSCILSEKPVEISIGDEILEFDLNNVNNLTDSIEIIRNKILNIMEQNNLHVKEIGARENEKSEILFKLEQANQDKLTIVQEKETLVDSYNILCSEKTLWEQDLRTLKNIQIDHSNLIKKYEQLQNSSNVTALQEQISKLEKKATDVYMTYKKFANHSIIYKTSIEKIASERNILEEILGKLKCKLVMLQTKLFYKADDREFGKLKEQIESFEFITEDIQKQFLRVSRKMYNIILSAVQIPIKIYDIVATDEIIQNDNFSDKIDFEEEIQKIIDCRDRANDLLEQMFSFENVFIMQKLTKSQKENVLQPSSNINVEIKLKEEDLKKKNTILRQRLTLAESAKGNLEKKVKQLRQENKKLTENCERSDMEEDYKILLNQHTVVKEEYEKTLKQSVDQCSALLQIRKEHKSTFKPDSKTKTQNEIEMLKLREAYGNLMSDNSKLDLENNTMRKVLEDRNCQLDSMKAIKEAYEHFLEENNKLRLELDTIKYKKNKGHESFLETKIKEVQKEYEGKLEKMKIKMLQIYKEQMTKSQNEKTDLLKTIEKLKKDLNEYAIGSKRRIIKRENSEGGDCELPCSENVDTNKEITVRSLNISNNHTVLSRRAIEDRKCATLPKSSAMTTISENSIPNRDSLQSVPVLGQNLKMEDEEDDMFNNKYLQDLKEGRCLIPGGRESNASRLSELKWRNSLCPPHLKSSYPAETQFSSPGLFKDEDLKTGTAEFNDSMTTRLISGDKPRKKDIGTTSYKRPGPPTPSKNGGRTSLQGFELHPRDVLRDHNDSKTPKRSTPSRIKSLFTVRSFGLKDNSENQPGTPNKRLSIFRKQK